MSEDDQERQGKTEAEWARERLEERMRQMRENVSGFFPPEFKDHVRRARREFWLAVRSLVDARLDAIEREAEPPPPPPRSGRIDID